MPRIGKKRSDRRYRAPDGTEWASKFEWEVYSTLRDAGHCVRPCDERDTISYTEQKTNARCVACGSVECVQDRTYTPDLFFLPQGEGSNGAGYYIEVKGYFRPEKRTLFRCMRKSRPDYDIRLVLQSNFRATSKSRIVDYCKRYLKDTKYHVWDGDIPGDWK